MIDHPAKGDITELKFPIGNFNLIYGAGAALRGNETLCSGHCPVITKRCVQAQIA